MKTFVGILTILLSLLTATGVFIHDVRLDKAAFSSGKHVYKRGAVGTPADTGLGGDPHTHPQSALKTLHGFSYQSPSIQPRETKYKRYLMQNIEPSGRHAFDNYNLPIVA